VRFYRLARAAFGTPATAFSGQGATVASHRWSWASPDLRAVTCSENLALACLENLVHIRPLPRRFPASVFFTVDIPEEHLERPPRSALPHGWSRAVPTAATRDFGTAFLRELRVVALIVPTAIDPIGVNAMINPLHPAFRLGWVGGPHPYAFDGRLE
jgi:RES domain-containing protein